MYFDLQERYVLSCILYCIAQQPKGCWAMYQVFLSFDVFLSLLVGTNFQDDDVGAFAQGVEVEREILYVILDCMNGDS